MIFVKRLPRRTAAMFRADLVKFLAKPKTKAEILCRFVDKEYGRGDDRVGLASSQVERQLAAALTSRLVKREGGKRYARYVVCCVGAANAARMEAALETRRSERRLAKGKRS